MADNPCKDLLDVFNDSVREVGGDELLAEYRAADRARKMQIADEVMEELDLKVKQQKLRGLAWDRLKGYFDSKKDKTAALNDLVSGSGARLQAGVVSLERRIDAILAKAHSDLRKMITAYRPRKLGWEHNKAFQHELIKEIFKKGSSSNKDAAQFASMWLEVTEKLRQRFNKAGGGIQKLFDWNLPQYHDSVKIKRASKDEWVADVKQWIDKERVGAYQVGDDGVVKGARLSDAQLDAFLRGAYDNLRTEGIIVHQNAQFYNPHIRRAIGNRHRNHRLLAFKDAESWIKYADKYGSNNFYGSMMSHLEIMAREIGAMELLGPNPDTMMKQLRVLAQQSTGQASTGWTAENAYKMAMGRMFSEDTKLSDSIRRMRNIVTGAKIGSATISAISDLGFIGKTAEFNGLPVMKVYSRFLKTLRSGTESFEFGARSGLLAEYGIDRAVAAHRISEVRGYDFSARFADTIVRGSFLNYWTLAAKHAFGMEFLAHLADLSRKSWDNLPDKMKKAFDRYGIDVDDWAAIQSGPKHTKDGVTFVDPMRYEDNELIAKVVGMVREEMNFAVPEPNAKARAYLTGGTPSGTLPGELVRVATQFKSFPVSIIMTHFARGLNEAGRADKLKYLASLIGGTTVLGAVALQGKMLKNGYTPKDMDDPAFWISAFAQGGGTGILGDFLFMDHTRFGSISDYLMGPTVGTVASLVNTFLGTGQRAIKGEDKIVEKFGAASNKLIRDLTPKTWYTGLVTERYLNDWIGQQMDRNWYRRQRSLQRRFRKEYGSRPWWPAGRMTPTF